MMNTEKIRELRERTGLGLKEAIARLEAAGGDVETAVNGRPSELENMSCRFAELQNEILQLRFRVKELEAELQRKDEIIEGLPDEQLYTNLGVMKIREMAGQIAELEEKLANNTVSVLEKLLVDIRGIAFLAPTNPLHGTGSRDRCGATYGTVIDGPALGNLIRAAIDAAKEE